MSGIIAVYGLVVSVLIAGQREWAALGCLIGLLIPFAVNPAEPYALFYGFLHLGAGLACGMTGLAAGYAIGIVGDHVRVVSICRHIPRCSFIHLYHDS
jgi:V-type H+-transporting ATPase proteolipid subunit